MARLLEYNSVSIHKKESGALCKKDNISDQW